MARDYYEILGVGKNASDDEIKKAFRKQAHVHHPDKGGGDEAKFKEVNEAYQVLSNKEKRARYDQFGAAGVNGPGGGPSGAGGGFGGFSWEDVMRQAGAQRGGGGFSGAEDIGDIFGDLFGFGRQRSAGRADTRGRDLQLSMTIDFREAVFGVTKSVEVELNTACTVCSGNGRKPGTKLRQCSTCHGRGQVLETRSTLLGQFQTARVCPTCHGAGEIPEEQCSNCKGTGRVRGTKRLDVEIPAGIDDGQTLRVTGQGDAGVRGARAGDLLITVRVRPDQRFRRDGEDILSRVSLTPAHAALGTTIDIQTVDGAVELKIPKGTQSGRVFRLKDRGVPSLNGRGRGDHLVEVIVTIPEKLSAKQKKLYEELRNLEE